MTRQGRPLSRLVCRTEGAASGADSLARAGLGAGSQQLEDEIARLDGQAPPLPFKPVQGGFMPLQVPMNQAGTSGPSGRNRPMRNGRNLPPPRSPAQEDDGGEKAPRRRLRRKTHRPGTPQIRGPNRRIAKIDRFLAGWARGMGGGQARSVLVVAWSRGGVGAAPAEEPGWKASRRRPTPHQRHPGHPRDRRTMARRAACLWFGEDGPIPAHALGAADQRRRRCSQATTSTRRVRRNGCEFPAEPRDGPAASVSLRLRKLGGRLRCTTGARSVIELLTSVDSDGVDY